MSIPGLGQIPSQPTTSATRTITLRPAWEFRFTTPPSSPVTIKLQSGTAEKDGIELAPRNLYTFSNVRTKITTWHGCEIEVEGATSEESVAQYATLAENPGNSLLNLHDKLNGLRDAAGREAREGPRILVTGEGSSGKTVVARTLTGYATRQGYQPLVVNMDPAEGMLTLPGCLSASVCATILDPEAVDGWGVTPTSGPSNVPVKLPLVQYYGRRTPEEDPQEYKGVVSRLAGSVSGRLSEDIEVRRSGVIIDGTSVGEKDEGVDMLAHVVDEFSVNVVVVIGTTRVNDEIARRFADEKTSLGETIAVIFLDKSDGAVERSPALAEHARQAVIKEYFFGDSRRTLSPQIQQVDFSSLTLYKVPDYPTSGQALVGEEPSSVMQHWTLAIMHASTRDPPDVVRAADVMGYIYVSDVDEERRKVKMLAPVSGRFGDRPMIWGKWPEPFINLLG